MKKLIIILLLFPFIVLSQIEGKFINNRPLGGPIDSVRYVTLLNFHQTSSGQTLTIPNLLTGSKIIYLRNVGTVDITFSIGGLVHVNDGVILGWTGSVWNVMGRGSISSTISGLTTNYLQKALTSTTIGNSPLYFTSSNLRIPFTSKILSQDSSVALSFTQRRAFKWSVFNPNYNEIFSMDSSGVKVLYNNTISGEQASLVIDSVQTMLTSTAKITLNSTNIYLPSGTANKLLYTDGSKNVRPVTLGTNISLLGNVLNVGSSMVPSNQIIGTIINDNMVTGNYTKVATTGSQTFSTGSAQMTGNSGNFKNNYIKYNYNGSTGTLLDQYTLNSTLIVNSDYSGSYGAALGIYQYQFNSTAGVNTFSVALSTQTAGTRGTVYLVDPYSSTVLATSSTKLVFTNSTDSILLSFRFERGVIQGFARNITTPTRTESGVVVPNITTISVALTPSDTGVYSRKGTPAIWSYGGTETFYNLTFRSELITDPSIIYVGDSRVYGYGASTFNTRFVAYLGFNGDDAKAMLWTRSSMMISEFTTGISELGRIINVSNPYVILAVGTNDVTAGHSLATIQADYLALISAVKTLGGIPVCSKIAYRSTAFFGYAAANIAAAAFNTWVATLGCLIIDESLDSTTGSNLTSYYTTDGIHYNDLGCLLLAKSLAAQINKFYRLKTNFGISGGVDILSSLSITGITSLSASGVYAHLSKDGRWIDIDFTLYGAASGTATNFTLPNVLSFTTATTVYPSGLLAITYDNSAFSATIGYWNTNTTTPRIINCYKGFPSTAWTASGNREVAGHISLPIN